jgi:phosphate transport system permease protein
MTTEALTPGYDPTAPLTPTGNLRRRKVINTVAETLARASALVALAVLGIVLYSVIHRGAPALNLDFITKNPPIFGGSSGGIANAILGTALIVGAATALAAPVGILIALYMTEFASPRIAGPMRLILDLMNGLPSMVIGVFVFGLLVVGHHQSGFAGSLGLAIVMLPLIARGTQEVLVLVPSNMREAADALGVSHFRSVLGVILPAALGGILTSTILAMARAAGETAPLLRTSSIFPIQKTSVDFFGQAIPNIPVMIFQLSDSADPAGYERAWGAAFVLLTGILVVSLAGRALLARSRRKLSQ